MGNLLIVDDDADLRESMAYVLRAEGHRVIEAADGQLALRALASALPVQLIILDLSMPVMDGPSFLEEKVKGAHADLPVVIFSSSTPAVRMEGFAGVVCFASKMDGLGSLLAAIRRVPCLPGAALLYPPDP